MTRSSLAAASATDRGTVPAMRRLRLALPLAGVAVLAACTTSTTDFRDQTEDFLNEDGQVEDLVDGDVTEAECEEPLDTEVGSRYSCTAQVANAGTFTFEVEINAEDSFRIFDFSPG